MNTYVSLVNTCVLLRPAYNNMCNNHLLIRLTA